MTCGTCGVPVRTQFASPDLVGAIVEGGLNAVVHLHNPSGTTATTRAADLPLPVFERFLAGRGVSLPGGARNG
ncbi:hypothetical protein DLE01_33200 [Streptomyces sp. FT05W]|nr:hypothetical protein [Streptomyces sp. FT05W]PWS46823.1 hypothetical protein DLE01_33200 [Streptomyces sp. FT05W]